MIDAGEPEEEADSDALVYVGRNGRVPLYLIAVPDDRDPTGLTVIHCTPNDWRQRGKG